MTYSFGPARKPADIVTAEESWFRPDARDAAAPAPNAFNTVSNNRFAETDPFQVNTITSGSQMEPAIATLPSGGLVSVWTTNQSVKLQVFDRHGGKVGAEFSVATGTIGNPAVVALAGGGFVVAWSDSESGDIDIWGRMFDAAGNPLAAQFLMSTESFGNPTQPSLAALSSGGFVASWTAQDVQFSSSGIKAQIFDAAGARVGGELLVNTTTNLEQYFSLTGALPGGGFVATWIDQVNGYRGQIFDAAGAKVGTDFSVGGGNFDLYNALTVLSSGNFVVATNDVDGDISGQIFSPTGALVGGPFKLNTATDKNYDMPTLTALPDGGFVASWRESTGMTPNAFEDGEIKAQVFDASGVKIGVEFMVNVGTAGGQMIPKVAAFGSGDFAIIWVDFPSSDSEIKARLYFSAVTGTNGNDNFVGTSDRDFYQGLDGEDQAAGAAADDTLDGGAGNDVLIGGTGADTMTGGAGNDTFYVDEAGDVVNESVGEGIDRIATSVSYALAAGAEVEQLEAVNSTDTIAMDLTANDFVNLVIGNAGVNLIFGLGGNDTLVGNGGNDFLVGGTGADLMYGGTGNDTFYVDDAGDRAYENAGEGTDRIATSISYTLDDASEVELLEAVNTLDTNAMDLTGSNSANLIIGNAGDNLLFGGGGNDQLVGLAGHDALTGGTGADLMYGGTGNDAYYVDDIGDRAYELAGEGTDRISTLISYTLDDSSEIELLESTNTTDTNAIDLTGSNSANTIIGNAGVNMLYGGGGNDTLVALGGNDFLIGGAGADLMGGGLGDDTFYVDDIGDQINEFASQGNDRVATSVSYTLTHDLETLEAVTRADTTALSLTGNAGANTIVGNDGANTLDGKGAADLLIGYGGADMFAFTTALGGGNVDHIFDFVSGTDKIALDDAIFGTFTANAFVAGTAAQDADDRIVYDAATGNLYFDADGSGSGAQVLFAVLDTHPILAASDFTVI